MLMRFDPMRDVDELFRSLGEGLRPASLTGTMDAYRQGDHFVVEVDLPGLAREDIDVTVERDVLQISAHRDAHWGPDDEVLVAERPRGEITRRLFLGDALDTSRVEAHYTDGVLRLRIPVAAEAKPRRIPIEGTLNLQAESGAQAAQIPVREPQGAVA
jgi:HSP20 family protein